MIRFNSQICTTRDQSERLLALGLKKETADMHYASVKQAGYPEWDYFLMSSPITNDTLESIPAWSLHRLIEMMPNKIRIYDDIVSLIVSNTKVQYYSHDVEYSDYLSCAGKWEDGNVYHNIISCIEWLIKEGYFNKEYLVNLTDTNAHQDMVDSFRYAFEALKK